MHIFCHLQQAFAQLNFTESAPGLVGCVALAAAFVLNWYVSRLLAYVHYTEPTPQHPEGRRMKTFLEVSEHVLGKKWTNILTPFQVINLYSTSIAYLIAAGQNSQGVYQTYTNDTSTKLLVFTSAATVVQLILSLFPSLESFKFCSALGATLSIVYRCES